MSEFAVWWFSWFGGLLFLLISIAWALGWFYAGFIYHKSLTSPESEEES